MLIEIKNDGKKLEFTNYWETDHCKSGYFYASVNAGCVRLMIPPTQDSIIPEIKTGKYVIISKGFWSQKNEQGIEIMFEDNSDSPFAIHIGTDQFDMLPKDGTKWRFAAYTQAGKVYEKPCKVRKVDKIPNMKSWGKE